jgi:hypothetical protein
MIVLSRRAVVGFIRDTLIGGALYVACVACDVAEWVAGTKREPEPPPPHPRDFVKLGQLAEKVSAAAKEAQRNKEAEVRAIVEDAPYPVPRDPLHKFAAMHVPAGGFDDTTMPKRESCKVCGASPLLFSARQRGDGLCSPCSRRANGTETPVDIARAKARHADVCPGPECCEPDPRKGPCTDPTKMNGYSDQFPGTDEGSQYDRP